jgi:hypothetical protein
MSWISNWGQSSPEQRCRDIEEQMNSRPDAGKLWRNMEKIGRIVNNKAPKSGSFFDSDQG